MVNTPRSFEESAQFFAQSAEAAVQARRDIEQSF